MKNSALGILTLWHRKATKVGRFALPLLTASCTSTQLSNEPWRTQRIECVDCQRVSNDRVRSLIAVAERDFSTNTAFPRSGQVVLYFSRALERPDHGILLIFVPGAISDTEVVYVFNRSNRLTDKYLRSFWR